MGRRAVAVRWWSLAAALVRRWLVRCGSAVSAWVRFFQVWPCPRGLRRQGVRRNVRTNVLVFGIREAFVRMPARLWCFFADGVVCSRVCHCMALGEAWPAGFGGVCLGCSDRRAWLSLMDYVFAIDGFSQESCALAASFLCCCSSRLDVARDVLTRTPCSGMLFSDLGLASSS